MVTELCWTDCVWLEFVLLLTLRHVDLFAGARYQVLLIPDCPGALNDLAHSGSLHRILTHFTSQQSEFHTPTFGWHLKKKKKKGRTTVALVVCVCVCRASLCSRTGSLGSVQRHRGADVDIRRLQLNRGELLSHVETSQSHQIWWRLLTAGFFFVCLLSVWQPSVFELVRRPDFANLPLVVEDFVKDYGGSYTGDISTSHKNSN